ncbi:hypothetical protein [Hyalangium versicolor]|uniref:hypothetical protein n=1 Tax=Hyalangium versicolor TaxID=2861190 RepID=UPI001CCAA7DF|nr:hypothetical protein [Hyalangium versicolor]
MEVNLNLVDSHLDKRLASEEARGDLRRIARMLPAVLGFQFECRLDSALPRVDLLPRLLLTDGSCDALLGLGDAPPTLPEAARKHPTWQALENLCREWRMPGGALSTGVMDVFLEFDLEQSAAEVPTPCVFVDFARSVRHSQSLAEQGLDLLLGDRLPAGIRRRLAACYEALPETARAYAVGVMFPRGTSPLRLCLSGATLPQWLTYLERIGWPGQLSEIKAQLGRMPELAERITLDIDVGESVGPKVGFEFFIDKPFGPSRPFWETLLGYLVERGLARPEKASAALSWVGYTPQRNKPEDEWPEGLRRASRELGAKAMSLFVRRLSHLKVAHQPGRALEAKIYLENLHRWLSYNEAKQGYVLDDNAPWGN